MSTPRRNSQMAALWNSGYTARSIAEYFAVGIGTVRRACDHCVYDDGVYTGELLDLEVKPQYIYALLRDGFRTTEDVRRRLPELSKKVPDIGVVGAAQIERAIR